METYEEFIHKCCLCKWWRIITKEGGLCLCPTHPVMITSDSNATCDDWEWEKTNANP